MTLGELLNVDSGRQTKSAGCNVELVKIYHSVKSEALPDNIKSSFGGRNMINIYSVVFKFVVTSDSGKKHTVFLKINPSADLKDSTAEVYCDCEDFKYRSAYTLGNGSGLFLNDKIKLSLGQALTTPPKRTPSLLCKHAYAAIMWLVSNYSNLIKTI